MGGYAPRPLPRSRLRKLPSAPLRRRTSLLEHCNGPMVAGWRGPPVSLIAHLAPHPGSTINSALGLSFRHCPAT